MIPTQPFGTTGHDSTRVIFGAAAFGDVTQQVADQTMELILEHGINHIDTAASYGDAELRLGPWMRTHRDAFFLATKTGERTYQAAHDEIRRSLERLQTDRLDLIQLHNLSDAAEREVAMAPGGALQAAIEARDEGLVDFIGVTGHGTAVPAMHLRSLAAFDFASVLLPYNHPMMRNEAYAADFEALAALCAECDVAMQTIKSITRAPWGDVEHNTTTWYRPLEDQAAIDTAVWWVLGRPGVFLNTASDPGILAKQLDAAQRFTTRPTEAEMAALEATWGMEPLFA